MNRKIYILIGALVLIVIIGVLLIVNAKNKPKSSEINFVTYSEEEKNFEKIIPDFEKTNNVKVNFIKKDLKNYEVESLNLLSTGKIDVWGIPNNWLPKQSNKLSYAPNSMEQPLKNTYPQTILDENVISDKVYGAPLSVDTLVLFENSSLKAKVIAEKKLTEQENTTYYAEPTNWDVLAGQAKIATVKSGSKITTSGLALGTTNLPASSDILTLLMLQNGAQMTSADKTQATFHTALNVFEMAPYPGATALDFYTSFGRPTNPNYSFSEDFGDPLRAFSEGKVVYYIDYSKKESDIKRINPNLNYKIRSFPQVKETKTPVNLLSYETLTVAKSSPNQEMAWKFIDYLTNSQTLQNYYMTSNNPPAAKTLLADAPTYIREAVENARSWWNPDAVQVEQIFLAAIADVLAGTTAQTALDGAAEKVTTLLGEVQR